MSFFTGLKLKRIDEILKKTDEVNSLTGNTELDIYFLIKTSGNKDPEIKMKSIKALGLLGHKFNKISKYVYNYKSEREMFDKIFNCISDRIEDEDKEVVAQSIISIGKLKDDRSMPLFEKIILSKKIDHVKSVLKELKKIKNDKSLELISICKEGDWPKEILDYAKDISDKMEKATINNEAKKLDKQLSLAVNKGDLTKVEEIFHKITETNTEKSFDPNLLIAALEHDYTEVASFLIHNNIDITGTSDNGEYPIFLSAKNNNSALFNLLIKKGADIFSKNADGDTLLISAARIGNLDFVKLLIKKGININCINNFGQSALTVATKNGHLESIKYLIENGSQVNILDNDDSNLIMIALKNERINVVKFLLEMEFDITHTNNNDWSVLHFASQINEVELLKLLIEKGADVNVINNNKQKPLDIAIKSGSYDNIDFFRSIIKKNHENDSNNDELIKSYYKELKNIGQSEQFYIGDPRAHYNKGRNIKNYADNGWHLRARKIGEELFNVGRTSLMRRVANKLKADLNPKLIQQLEYAWHGIGSKRDMWLA